MYPPLQSHAEQFHGLEILYALPIHFLSPEHLVVINLFTVFIILPVSECFRVGIIRYVVFRILYD